jgi:hypothetical protein
VPAVCGLASRLPVVCDPRSADQHEFGEPEGLGILVDGFSEPAYPTVARRFKVLLDDRSRSKGCPRLAEAL